jgi:hypothetical protein
MSIEKFLSAAAIAIVILCVLFTGFGLIHELTHVSSPEQLIHSLEEWANVIGYRLSLIVLAASGVLYLSRKK